MTSSSRAVDPVAIGETLAGRYRVLRRLGEGGMGVVYEAERLSIARRVAVKLMHGHLARREQLRLRFEREARTAGRLRHENIVSVIDFDVTERGIPFLVMELVDGEPLARILRGGALPVRRAARLAQQVAWALDAAHATNVVHRDLKPENLLVTRAGDGRDLVKVLDFGIAKIASSDEEEAITRTGATMGTAAYMSPEQARGTNDVDVRTDVYALGAILYEMLAGVRAHPGSSYNQVIFQILNGTPAALDDVRPGLPPGLSAVAARALACDPSERIASAREFSDALAPYARSARTRGDAGVLPPSDTTRPEPAGGASHVPMTPPSGVVLPAARPPARWGIVAAAGGALFAAVLVARLQRGDSSEARARTAPSFSRAATPTASSARSPFAVRSEHTLVDGSTSAPPDAGSRADESEPPARASEKAPASTPTAPAPGRLTRRDGPPRSTGVASKSPSVASHAGTPGFDRENPFR